MGTVSVRQWSHRRRGCKGYNGCKVCIVHAVCDESVDFAYLADRMVHKERRRFLSYASRLACPKPTVRQPNCNSQFAA